VEKPVIKSKLSWISLYSVLGFASEAFFVGDFYLGRPVCERIRERWNIGGRIARAVDGGNDIAAIGAQHAALVCHLDAGNAFAQPVHRARGIATKGAVLSHPADGSHVVVALVHLFEQIANLFRRILQVCVEGDNARTSAMLEASHDRHVLAVIAVEQNHPGDVRPPLELLAQDGGRPVTRTIVGK